MTDDAMDAAVEPSALPVSATAATDACDAVPGSDSGGAVAVGGAATSGSVAMFGGAVPSAAADASAPRRPRGPSVGTIALAACLFVVGGVAVMLGLPFPDFTLAWMGSDPCILGVVVITLISAVFIIAVIWSTATIIYNMTHPATEP